MTLPQNGMVLVTFRRYCTSQNNNNDNNDENAPQKVDGSVSNKDNGALVFVGDPVNSTY
jgi:hypothetical protein